eukprot:gb/GEZJ01001900.1/.p1 GENE.gb/GEZJ01001900.1/~~gb/GEZJ01001900.1/.p1  ORF type:complete len:253 (-),score=30.17 gb/GEZJ01001900.1/:339-1097(-)
MDYLRSRASYSLRGGSRTETVESSSIPAPPATMFDFEQMTCAFEACHTQFLTTKSPLPTTTAFVAAMQHLCYLFDTLGSGFSFVKSDIESKLIILKRYQTEQPTSYSYIQTAIEHEMKHNAMSETGFVYAGGPAFTRTLLRLMWALKFTDRLLDSLAQAFDANSAVAANQRTLRWAVATAYDAALAQHHSWTIRKTVKGACLLLPSKESFMNRIRVKEEDQQHYLTRLGNSMSPLVTRLYDYYAKYDLLDLP